MAKEVKQDKRKDFDDLEILKIVLEDNPALKQRVLHKIRELRSQMDDGEELQLSSDTKKKLDLIKTQEKNK